MALLLRRTPADSLSAAFAAALGSTPSEPPLVGVEHEFRVLAGERPVDFRKVIHGLGLRGRRLDPADRDAYRGAWGGSITADGREAELAIPPQPVGPGFSRRAAAAALRGRDELREALPRDLGLEGYSTHLSVSVPAGLEERIARRFAATFAPALAAIMDGPASPGLLVRPRPGRLELGAEFVDGDRLRAAMIFATGATLAIRAVEDGARPIRPIQRRWRARMMPPSIALDVEPAVDRFGWLVRGVAGADLHRDGRRARIRTTGHGRRALTLQAHLDGTWSVARRALAGLARGDELELVDRLVSGASPLGVELQQAAAIAMAAVSDAAPTVADSSPEAALDAAFGAAVLTRRRPGMRVEPAMLGWDFAVLRITEDLGTVDGRTAFACLPRSALGRGLEALDRGHLDAILRAYLNLRSDPRVLAGAPQTRRPGLFGAVAAGSKLLAQEFGPERPGADRPGKRHRPRDQQGQPSLPPAPPSGISPAVPATAAAVAGLTLFGLPAAAIAGVATVATVAVIGGAVFLGGGNPAGSPAASSPGTDPTATVAAPGGSPSGNPVGPVGLADPVSFGQGSTTMTIATEGGDFGDVELALEFGEIGPDGFLRAIWGDGAYDPVTGSSGATEWFTMRGTAFADGSFEQGLGGLDLGASLASGEQAATGPDGAHCTVEFSRTPTLGILGTYVCNEIDDRLGPYQASGTYWAEPGGDIEPGPDVAYTGGTASMRLTGEASAAVEGMLFANELASSDPDAGPDAPIYPGIVWSDAGAVNTFSIWTLEPHATGTLSTADGTLGVGWFFDVVDFGGYTDWYPGGIGLSHGPPGDGLGCTATIRAAADGSISGSVSCVNVNDPSLPIGLEATFVADFSDLHYEGGTVLGMAPRG